MKARAVVLVVGISMILGLGGFIAYQSPWVRSLLARSTVDPVELERGMNAPQRNHQPADAATGSPQWRGASRSGVAPVGSFRTDWDKKKPVELWRQQIGGGYGSCAVVGGKLYVQDRQGATERVVCLDAETGKPVWDYAYEAGQAGNDSTYAIGPRATPTVIGNTVYAVGGSGKLLVLDVENNAAKLKWEHDLLPEFQAPTPQWGVACSPLVLGDLVIVMPGGKDAAVVAFDRTSGAVKWKAGSNPPGYSSPIAATIGGQATVFAFLGDALLAVRAADGAVTDSFKWATQYTGNIATPVVVDDEYVFVSSAYGMGCALLRAEKQGADVKLVKVYENRGRAFQSHHATGVFKDKHLFGVDGTRGARGLTCIEFMTGKTVPDWEWTESGQASVILAGNHLILQTERGDLCLVEANPKEFNLVAKIPKVLSGNNNWATPTLVNGLLYVRDEQKVLCFDVRP
ncbi:outer membrane biogenesis protein BamB [Gemmata sp. SH-PL17]|uniref:outer membrane protein assembly factor BamB family protein n=1 Tax=Gemmata sp. SH-PL17 TaxID=1630693 RepID=UPI00078E6964|nr:PQQ-binding-like beta-propeller repeat protein [Gemmata sp. SH-PL17]AMV26153.1 outer membrane biogenesis protein BamB [Gemmata sp. SH-PL17]